MLDLNIDSIPFAVFGSDKRQKYLADLLTEKGCPVFYYENFKDFDRPAEQNAKICLLPIPLGDCPDVFISGLQHCHTLFAGCIPPAFEKKAEECKIVCHDYMRDEKLIWQNTIATAEGAIAEAMIRFPGNLTRSRCLVIGYGHCGQTLVAMLNRFLCHITVCDSSESTRSHAAIHAEQCIAPEQLAEVLPNVSCIFNTAPTLVLSEELLKLISEDTLILDLASAPGGVDYEKAAALNRQAFLLPGLPGKYAPRASAEIMLDFILRHIQSTAKRI